MPQHHPLHHRRLLRLLIVQHVRLPDVGRSQLAQMQRGPGRCDKRCCHGALATRACLCTISAGGAQEPELAKTHRKHATVLVSSSPCHGCRTALRCPCSRGAACSWCTTGSLACCGGHRAGELLHHLEDAMAARRVDLILWAGPRSSRSCTTKDLVDDYSVCQGSD